MKLRFLPSGGGGIPPEEDDILIKIIGNDDGISTGLQTIDVGNKNLLQLVNTSKTINGVTFTVNNDGSVTADGTATDVSIFPLNYEGETGGKRPSNLPKGNYILYDFVGDYKNYFTQFSGNDIKGNQIYANTGSQYNINSSEDMVYGAWIYIRKGVTVNNVVFKPTLIKGNETPTEYVKHESQSYELDLCSIKLGKNDYIYNYSDAWFVSIFETGEEYRITGSNHLEQLNNIKEFIIRYDGIVHVDVTAENGVPIKIEIENE